ncbi:MAG: DNA translocase FtsK 4TM domain-containing protein [Candidatus Aminicenantes bacterium]|nr:MAG: DNA translocase FtsK 4TM domain-containing protein [Candidatus Aminicenantes bacterium]
MNKVKKRQDKGAKNLNQLLLKNEIIGIILLLISIFFIFSIVSYTPSDPSFFNSPPRKNVEDRRVEDRNVENYGGRLGAQVSAILFNLFGYSSYVLLFYLLFMTSYFLFNQKIQNVITKSFGYLLLLVASSGFLSIVKEPVKDVINGVEKYIPGAGGFIGDLIGLFFKSGIKSFFSGLLFLVLIAVSLILIAKLSLGKVMKFLFEVSAKLVELVTQFVKTQYAKYKKYRSQKRIREKYNVNQSSLNKEPSTRENEKPVKERKEKRIVRKPSGLPEEGSLFSNFEEEIARLSKYKPPPLSYLDAPTERSQIDFKELEEKKEELKQRLDEFRIRGEIMEYTPGPVITTYEFVPDTGVKVRDVTNLSEDLALVARAQYVRIERILGKKAIGIEIPNKKREIIHLREILESEDYQQSRSPLTIGIGKTKSGEIFVSDLREMPHLIIAGATGSGKSVAIHSLLLSILYKSSPDEVKLVLIDPKRVELALYNQLPHLLTPVVVNTKLAKNALDWAVFEMEVRYKKLAVLQARSVEQYNRKLGLMLQAEDENLEKLEDTEKIPYVVIVIDEFADLMMEAGKDIENDVARIAQKARAVGIHLILATQRPSTDVITGTIKNNFPSRIAMAVPSKHDSRTIIDIMGAEKLLGHGDMLFLPPKTATLVRLHCAYVSEEEILRVVNYLSKTGRPKFNSQVVKPKAEEEGEALDKGLDDMFFEAAEVVILTGQASASFLQRKMSIGYARAGRLIDQLQAHGVVSAADSKNKRDILMTTDDLHELQKER